jgi:glycosyltransferase involved in cell wall biosynthesis
VRILKVSQVYFPFLDRGGPAVKVRAIAAGLTRRGHHVSVLTADLGIRNAGTLAGALERRRWGWRVEEDGIEALYLRTLARYRILTVNPDVLRFAGASLESFDVAHVYGLYDFLGPAIGFSCQRRGIPYVLEPMGMFRPIVRNIPLKRLYHRLLGRRLIRGASRLIATSDQEKDELLEGGIEEERVVVRRNGIEVPERFPPPGSFRHKWHIPPDASLILFLGRLVSKKSPDMLLEAFARWRQHGGGKAGVLVLAGPDEGDAYLRRLKILAGDLDLGKSVLFTGPLYGDAKWAAYQDADVFVLPSQHENFGNTAAESIASGTPVILTDRCGIASMIDQRAGMVIPYDVEKLEASLARILAEPDPRRRYRSGCVEVTRALSWAEPLERLEGLYSQLVAEARRR